MAIGMIMEFDGFRPENYDAVSQEIGWPENWPKGLSFHVAGETADGMRLVEIWDSREQLDAFGEHLMPLLKDEGIELQGKPEMLEIHNIVKR